MNFKLTSLSNEEIELDEFSSSLYYEISESDRSFKDAEEIRTLSNEETLRGFVPSTPVLNEWLKAAL